MVRKHTRRAAKAAYAISLAVAIVIGLIAAGAGTAAPSAKPTVTGIATILLLSLDSPWTEVESDTSSR